MLEPLKSFLSKLARDDAELDLEDARLCATALMVEAALADGVYATIEEELISEVVKATWKLGDEAAAALLDQAEQVAEQAVDQHRFTKVVKRLPEPERIALIEGLWRVVFADGEESPYEEAFVRKIADLLHVDPRASRLARQRVLAETGAALGDDDGESAR